MKFPLIQHRSFMFVIAAFLSLPSTASAQVAAGPLNVQGLDQSVLQSARGRAMGGTGVASSNDASALFLNPAALTEMSAFELRFGGFLRSTTQDQTQQWTPNRTHPGLSLLFENLWGGIKAPDTVDATGGWLSPQKAYDDLTPNWRKGFTTTRPFSLMAALPFEFSGMKLAAAVGYSEMIDLDHYYQNNNSMSPYPGQHRLDPVIIPKQGDTLRIKWYQYTREREGAVNGFTPGLSIMPIEGLSIGASLTFLSGTSDDYEHRRERGNLRIIYNNFIVDTVYYDNVKTGTSTYSGTSMSLGVLYRQDRFRIGMSIKPKMTVTREWSSDVTIVDTTIGAFPIRIDSSRTYHANGTDKVELPFSYTLGIGPTPNDRWTVAFDYEIKNLSEAVFEESSGSSTNPWVNTSMMRFGAEYKAAKWLALRAGYREALQAVSPDGSAIVNDPARGAVYSLGIGLLVEGIMIDAAYEYAELKYQDMYQSNVNYNDRYQRQAIFEIAYRF